MASPSNSRFWAQIARFFSALSDEEKDLLADKRNFYLISFENLGGLVMPVIFDAEFEDGTRQHVRIPAEIWKLNNQRVTKLLMTEKPIKSIVLDPRLETADVELENNFFPRRIMKSRFELYKDSRRGGGGNPMKTANGRNKKDGDTADKKGQDEPLTDKER